MKKNGVLALLALSSSALLCASALAAPSNSKPQLVPVTASSLKKEIAARKGKVVIVNFWATWCLPCQTEFPALLQLQKKYAAKGVSLLFVSADSPRNTNTKVRPFLQKMKVTQPTRIIGGNSFTFIEQFDPAVKDAFVLPRFYVYNRKGSLVKSFTNTKVSDNVKTNLGEFEKLVKPLL